MRVGRPLLKVFMYTCQFCRFAFTNDILKNVICLKMISHLPIDYPPFDFLSWNCGVLADDSCVNFAPRFFHQKPLPLEKFFRIEDIQDIVDNEVVQLDLFENAHK